MNKQPKKFLTFSYDDGVTQDARLVELFNKYGMKATFNINSGSLGAAGKIVLSGITVNHSRISKQDLCSVYEGHEVAGHTLTHPNLADVETDAEVIRQVEADRLQLSELCGYEVTGFAYPFGLDNDCVRVPELLRTHTGIHYARTVLSTHRFELPKDPMRLHPTVYHLDWDKLFSLGEQFLSLQTEEKQIFYVWGHSYEFDTHDTWGKFEEFLRMMSGKPDIAYVTNRDALLAESGGPL